MEAPKASALAIHSMRHQRYLHFCHVDNPAQNKPTNFLKRQTANCRKHEKTQESPEPLTYLRRICSRNAHGPTVKFQLTSLNNHQSRDNLKDYQLSQYIPVYDPQTLLENVKIPIRRKVPLQPWITCENENRPEHPTELRRTVGWNNQFPSRKPHRLEGRQSRTTQSPSSSTSKMSQGLLSSSLDSAILLGNPVHRAMQKISCI